MKTWILILPLLLTGCLNNEPRQNATGPTIKNDPISPVLVDPGQVNDIKKEIQTSQNAIQTNMQAALGVSVGKISDDLIRASASVRDLIHAELNTQIGDIKTKMEASIASNNELRAMLKIQMDINTSLHAELRSQIEANMKLSSKIEAIVAAQAGVGNKIESTKEELKQSFSAGHDVNSSTVQFNKDMLESLKSANQVSIEAMKQLAYILVSLFGVLCTIVSIVMRNRAKRAETQVVAKDFTLQRALGALPPDIAQKIIN